MSNEVVSNEPDARRPPRDRGLDGLRGLAVLVVLLSHASNIGLHVMPGLDMQGTGRSGVFLFFVLSSLLLTAQLVERDELGARDWLRYAGRRAARVWPAYVLALGLYLLLGHFESRWALDHALLLRAQGHFWTIPVEVLFYVALPALVLVLRALPRGVPRVVVVVALAIALRIAFPADYPSRAPEYRPAVAPFLPVFLVGSACAVMVPGAIGASRRSRAAELCGWIGLAVLITQIPAVHAALTGEAIDRQRTHLAFDEQAVLWSVVVLGVLRGGGALRRLLSAAPLRWLGVISYSTYLLHRLVLEVVGDPGRDLPVALRGPLFLGGAVLAGALGYFLVERPFIGSSAGNASRSETVTGG